MVFWTFCWGRISCFITIFYVRLAFFLSCLAFYEVRFAGSSTYLSLMTWLESYSFHVDWAFCFDSLTVVMIIVVIYFNSGTFIFHRIQGEGSKKKA